MHPNFPQTQSNDQNHTLKAHSEVTPNWSTEPATTHPFLHAYS